MCVRRYWWLCRRQQPRTSPLLEIRFLRKFNELLRFTSSLVLTIYFFNYVFNETHRSIYIAQDPACHAVLRERTISICRGIVEITETNNSLPWRSILANNSIKLSSDWRPVRPTCSMPVIVQKMFISDDKQARSYTHFHIPTFVIGH